jgi:hypothetical protein
MPRTPAVWRQRIQEAASEEAVVEVVRSYLDGWSPAETQALPPRCWPEGIQDRDDVCAWAVTVARERLKAPPAGESDDLIEALTETLREAATRLSQLSAESRVLGPRDNKK